MKTSVKFGSFRLGRIVLTSGVASTLCPQDVQKAVARHMHGDWGQLDEDDKKMNDQALIDGDRLLSRYVTFDGTPFYVITEWDRSVTTILLTDEY